MNNAAIPIHPVICAKMATYLLKGGGHNTMTVASAHDE